MNELIENIRVNKEDGTRGVYSVCCAHPLVIEAAIRQALQDDSPVLIEATANQVNQFGGYTGMKPNDFVKFVHKIADKVGYPKSRVVLGGDHLGPTCWTNENSVTAMEKSKALIESYVAAGFKKIHLDTSMQCADDLEPLSDEIVAERAAELCEVAETTAIKQFGYSDIGYIIGTEVPPPGGAKEEINSLDVTPVSNVKATLETHKSIFHGKKLQNAFDRVLGLVVQPGVEFDNFNVFQYDSAKAQQLKRFIASVEGIVYEAHSTDYQPSEAYQSLVNDHFAILKVGPQLTFALREALFALESIEQELICSDDKSCLKATCEQVMLDSPNGWRKFYPNEDNNLSVYRKYSFSDRIRYYWPETSIQRAVDKLIVNLEKNSVPLPLLSQFMPYQYKAVLSGKLANNPTSLILDRIMQVTDVYSKACFPKEI